MQAFYSPLHSFMTYRAVVHHHSTSVYLYASATTHKGSDKALQRTRGLARNPKVCRACPWVAGQPCEESIAGKRKSLPLLSSFTAITSTEPTPDHPSQNLVVACLHRAIVQTVEKANAKCYQCKTYFEGPSKQVHVSNLGGGSDKLTCRA